MPTSLQHILIFPLSLIYSLYFHISFLFPRSLHFSEPYAHMFFKHIIFNTSASSPKNIQFPRSPSIYYFRITIHSYIFFFFFLPLHALFFAFVLSSLQPLHFCNLPFKSPFIPTFALSIPIKYKSFPFSHFFLV